MRLVAEDVSLDIVRAVREVVGVLGRQDVDLARQLKRAVNSIGFNVSEGERRVGRDRLHLFRVAAGSAKEAQRCLMNAEAWGYVTEEQTAEAHRHLDRELGLLWGLTHTRQRVGGGAPDSGAM